MSEPLRNKKREYRLGLANDIPIHVFDAEDVESAVGGLYEEIRTLDNETMHPSRKILACRIIKKWFPDMIEK